MIVSESLLMAILGTAMGLLLGVWMAWVLLKGIQSYGVPYPFTFRELGLLLATAAGFIFGVLAVLASARRAANQRFINALARE